MDERARELAEEAECNRCKVVILDETSAVGLVYGTYRVPASNTTLGFKLCGKCGLVFREFLHPEMVVDDDFQDTKRQLIQLWG